jgi:DNA mismatch repair protein MutL
MVKYGFDIQEFDSSTYLLRSVPSMMSIGDPSKSLVDVLDLISVEGLLRKHEEIVAASVACHSAIRAGRVLRIEEMNSLVRNLEATANPHTCPHGRPTVVRYADYQTEREFGRR